MKKILNKALREPLLHFLLLGAGLFGIYGLVGKPTPDSSGQIVVTRGRVEQLVVGFERTWQRPPTEQDLKGLIEDYIREEVLYRQAKTMGLDQDDTIVRRRMRQKLEFLTEDLASQTVPPTEQELAASLEKHADQYREEPKLTFEHVFFNRKRRGTSAEAAAKSLLTQLNGKHGSAVNLAAAGNASLLPVKLNRASQSEIARLFGEKFSQRLLEVDPGYWAGPIESSYGLHLVFVRERAPGSLPELVQVRDAVRRDLLAERRKQALEAAYTKLRQHYTVVLEQPKVELGSAAKSGDAR